MPKVKRTSSRTKPARKSPNVHTNSTTGGAYYDAMHIVLELGDDLGFLPAPQRLSLARHLQDRGAVVDSVVTDATSFVVSRPMSAEEFDASAALQDAVRHRIPIVGLRYVLRCDDARRALPVADALLPLPEDSRELLGIVTDHRSREAHTITPEIAIASFANRIPRSLYDTAIPATDAATPEVIAARTSGIAIDRYSEVSAAESYAFACGVKGAAAPACDGPPPFPPHRAASTGHGHYVVLRESYDGRVKVELHVAVAPAPCCLLPFRVMQYAGSSSHDVHGAPVATLQEAEEIYASLCSGSTATPPAEIGSLEAKQRALFDVSGASLPPVTSAVEGFVQRAFNTTAAFLADRTSLSAQVSASGAMVGGVGLGELRKAQAAVVALGELFLAEAMRGDATTEDIVLTDTAVLAHSRWRRIALGTVYDTTQHEYDLARPPLGFDSVHGAPAAGGAFTDHEYVVYTEAQQRLQFIVEIDASALTAADAASSSNKCLDVAATAAIGAERDAVLPVERVTPLTDQKITVKAPVVGLQANDATPVPLRRTDIKAQVIDTIAEVTLLQEYFNAGSAPVEAKYVFPLQGGAAVCGFEAFINHKHVVGTVKEKEQAHKEYKAAVAAGHGAYLMDESEETPDVFTISVGNLPPKTRVVVKVTYVIELGIDAARNAIEFIIPSHVHPAKVQKELATKTQRSTATVAAAGAGAVTLELGLDMPFDITAVECSHNVQRKRTACRATVRSENLVMDGKDFVCAVRLAAMNTPRIWVEEDTAGSKAAMITFFPSLDEERAAAEATALSKEVLLLLDASASMAQGDAAKDAKVAALHALTTLPDSAIVNVAMFGSRTVHALPMAAPLADCRPRLEAWIQTEYGAVLGVTDLAPVLLGLGAACRDGQNATTELPGHARPRREVDVLLFSDGLLCDEPRVLAVLRAAPSLRVFTIAVGSAASAPSMYAAARAGRGQIAVLRSGAKSRWAAALERQATRIAQPALTDISVEWSTEHSARFRRKANAAVTQSPASVPCVFSGESTVVYGVFPHQARQCELVARHTGAGSERDQYGDWPEERFLVTATGTSFRTGALVHRLAAKARIRDWTDGSLLDLAAAADDDLASTTESVAVGAVHNEAQKAATKQAIIGLGCRYGLVTPFTSMVAMEVRTDEERAAQSRGKGEAACTTPAVAVISDSVVVDPIPEVSYLEEHLPWDRLPSIPKTQTTTSTGPTPIPSTAWRPPKAAVPLPIGALPPPNHDVYAVVSPTDLAREAQLLGATAVTTTAVSADGCWDRMAAAAREAHERHRTRLAPPELALPARQALPMPNMAVDLSTSATLSDQRANRRSRRRLLNAPMRSPASTQHQHHHHASERRNFLTAQQVLAAAYRALDENMACLARTERVAVTIEETVGEVIQMAIPCEKQGRLSKKLHAAGAHEEVHVAVSQNDNDARVRAEQEAFEAMMAEEDARMEEEAAYLCCDAKACAAVENFSAHTVPDMADYDEGEDFYADEGAAFPDVESAHLEHMADDDDDDQHITGAEFVACVVDTNFYVPAAAEEDRARAEQEAFGAMMAEENARMEEEPAYLAMEANEERPTACHKKEEALRHFQEDDRKRAATLGLGAFNSSQKDAASFGAPAAPAAGYGAPAADGFGAPAAPAAGYGAPAAGGFGAPAAPAAGYGAPAAGGFGAPAAPAAGYGAPAAGGFGAPAAPAAAGYGALAAGGLGAPAAGGFGAPAAGGFGAPAAPAAGGFGAPAAPAAAGYGAPAAGGFGAPAAPAAGYSAPAAGGFGAPAAPAAGYGAPAAGGFGAPAAPAAAGFGAPAAGGFGAPAAPAAGYSAPAAGGFGAPAAPAAGYGALAAGGFGAPAAPAAAGFGAPAAGGFGAPAAPAAGGFGAPAAPAAAGYGALAAGGLGAPAAGGFGAPAAGGFGAPAAPAAGGFGAPAAPAAAGYGAPAAGGFGAPAAPAAGYSAPAAGGFGAPAAPAAGYGAPAAGGFGAPAAPAAAGFGAPAAGGFGAPAAPAAGYSAPAAGGFGAPAAPAAGYGAPAAGGFGAPAAPAAAGYGAPAAGGFGAPAAPAAGYSAPAAGGFGAPAAPAAGYGAPAAGGFGAPAAPAAAGYGALAAGGLGAPAAGGFGAPAAGGFGAPAAPAAGGFGAPAAPAAAGYGAPAAGGFGAPAAPAAGYSAPAAGGFGAPAAPAAAGYGALAAGGLGAPAAGGFGAPAAGGFGAPAAPAAGGFGAPAAPAAAGFGAPAAGGFGAPAAPAAGCGAPAAMDAPKGPGGAPPPPPVSKKALPAPAAIAATAAAAAATASSSSCIFGKRSVPTVASPPPPRATKTIASMPRAAPELDQNLDRLGGMHQELNAEMSEQQVVLDSTFSLDMRSSEWVKDDMRDLLGLRDFKLVDCSEVDALEEKLHRQKLTALSEVEQNLDDLHGMYQEFSAQMCEQQVALAEMDSCIDSSTMHVEKGVSELQAASRDDNRGGSGGLLAAARRSSKFRGKKSNLVMEHDENEVPPSIAVGPVVPLVAVPGQTFTPPLPFEVSLLPLPALAIKPTHGRNNVEIAVYGAALEPLLTIPAVAPLPATARASVRLAEATEISMVERVLDTSAPLHTQTVGPGFVRITVTIATDRSITMSTEVDGTRAPTSVVLRDRIGAGDVAAIVDREAAVWAAFERHPVTVVVCGLPTHASEQWLREVMPSVTNCAVACCPTTGLATGTAGLAWASVTDAVASLKAAVFAAPQWQWRLFSGGGEVARALCAWTPIRGETIDAVLHAAGIQPGLAADRVLIAIFGTTNVDSSRVSVLRDVMNQIGERSSALIAARETLPVAHLDAVYRALCEDSSLGLGTMLYPYPVRCVSSVAWPYRGVPCAPQPEDSYSYGAEGGYDTVVDVY